MERDYTSSMFLPFIDPLNSFNSPEPLDMYGWDEQGVPALNIFHQRLIILVCEWPTAKESFNFVLVLTIFLINLLVPRWPLKINKIFLSYFWCTGHFLRQDFLHYCAFPKPESGFPICLRNELAKLYLKTHVRLRWDIAIHFLSATREIKWVEVLSTLVRTIPNCASRSVTGRRRRIQ